ncbi:7154_t:CDS:1, partial [Gigaspora rosea]
IEVEQDESEIFEYYETAMSQVAHYFKGRKRFKKIEPLVFD